MCASATEPFPHPRSIAGRVLKQKAAKEADQQKASASRGHVPDKPGAGKHDLGSGAIVHYHPEAFKGNAALLFTQLVQDIPWLHRTIKVMGRPVLQPRLVCYMADDASLRYTYSGTQWDPVAWTSCVLQIKVGLSRHDCWARHTRDLYSIPAAGTCGSTCTNHIQFLLAQLLS